MKSSPWGYIETPSPADEMLCCSYPYDPSDIHIWFVWANQKRSELHVIKKSERTICEFSSSKHGKLAEVLTLAKRANPDQVPDRILPRIAKTTVLFFSGPITLHVHESFEAALLRGEDAFACLKSALPFLRPPISWVYPRFTPLKEI